MISRGVPTTGLRLSGLGSSCRSELRRTIRLAAAALALLLAVPRAAWAADSVELTVEAAGEELFVGSFGGLATLEASPGQRVMVGRYDRLKIEKLDQVTLQGPDGRQYPLIVDASSRISEFGRWTVALQFAALVPEAEAEPGRAGFTLKWGPEIKAANSEVPQLVCDPARRELYRSLRVRSNARFASIDVIADSTAEYHFLWYLLPMALVFALLAARKLRARGPSDPAAS